MVAGSVVCSIFVAAPDACMQDSGKLLESIHMQERLLHGFVTHANKGA